MSEPLVCAGAVAGADVVGGAELPPPEQAALTSRIATAWFQRIRRL